MKCPACYQSFESKSPRQKYCSEECQIKYNKKRGRLIYSATKRTPNWICSHCKHKTKLPFYPIKDAKKWLKWKCPHCKKKAQALIYT